MPLQHTLDPRSQLCLHWIAWPRKPTLRIKQRVASCHTAEVTTYIDSKFTWPTPNPKGTTDLRGGWWDPIHVWHGRPHTKTVITILVPKLVAIAAYLRPSISAMSSLNSLTRKPTLRIKQRVASCHTAEVGALWFYFLRYTNTLTYLLTYLLTCITTDWPYCFIFPDFPRIRERRVVSILGPQIGENWGFFAPQIFMEHVWTPYKR